MITGFDSAHRAVVVRRAAHHQPVGGVPVEVFVDVGRPAVVGGGGHQCLKARQAQGVPREKSHIPGGGVGFGIGKPMGRGEFCAGHPQLLRPFIHHFDEVGHRAVSDVVGDHHRSLVGVADHHSIHQLLDGNFLILVKPRKPDSAERNILAVHLILDVSAHGRHGVFRIFNLLEGKHHRHQLCKGRRLDRFVGILLADDHIAVEVDQIDRLGGKIKIRGVGCRKAAPPDC